MEVVAFQGNKLTDHNARFPLTEPYPTRWIASLAETRRGLAGGRSLTVYFHRDRVGTLTPSMTGRGTAANSATAHKNTATASTAHLTERRPKA